MFTRSVRATALTVVAAALAGCASSIYYLKVPLFEGSAQEPRKPEARVVIEDVRPDEEKRPHRGKDIRSCERWFGDDTVEPSKLDYLASRVSERTRADMHIHVLLKRFDIVEYCEFVPVGNGTGAATAGFTAAPAIGDTVVMHLAGDVNGVPFDFESRFDYARMYRFPHPPSSSPQYVAQLRGRLDELTKGVSNLVWSAELRRLDEARK
jgi:hypothetical protein